MPFELRDHTADVAVAATEESLGAVFAAVADGLAAAMCESIPDGGERFAVAVSAESREALLYDYLDELIYQRDVRSVLPVDNEAAVRSSAGRDGTADEDEPPVRTATGNAGDEDRWHLEASARGVPLAAVDAREIKAVTYSEMALEERPEGWRAYVVFDV